MCNVVSSEEKVKLAMIGYVEGNGHPYSWSAIINGYDPQRMSASPYPVIADYLGEQPLDEISIPTATVSHIWTENPTIAQNIADATFIQNVVDSPSDVIGGVDGIIIPTDDGEFHVDRIKPFIGSDMPVFVDKPLATNTQDLRQFIEWENCGEKIASSSAMRYAPAVDSLANSIGAMEDVLWVTNATHKTWSRYGIHALEPVARLFGAGFDTIECATGGDTKVFTITHKTGVTITIGVNYTMRGGFCRLSLYGAESEKTVIADDTYTTFRRQLLDIIKFVKTGSYTVPFGETVDLMACIIAGQWSIEREDSVSVSEVYDNLPINGPAK